MTGENVQNKHFSFCTNFIRRWSVRNGLSSLPIFLLLEYISTGLSDTWLCIQERVACYYNCQSCPSSSLELPFLKKKEGKVQNFPSPSMRMGQHFWKRSYSLKLSHCIHNPLSAYLLWHNDDDIPRARKTSSHLRLRLQIYEAPCLEFLKWSNF